MFVTPWFTLVLHFFDILLPHLFITHLSTLLLFYSGYNFIFQSPKNEIRIVVKNVIEGNITFDRHVYTASVKEVIKNRK